MAYRVSQLAKSLCTHFMPIPRLENGHFAAVLGVWDRLGFALRFQARDPNGRAYNRTAHLPERKKMMQAWADYLDRLNAEAGEKLIRTHPQSH